MMDKNNVKIVAERSDENKDRCIVVRKNIDVSISISNEKDKGERKREKEEKKEREKESSENNNIVVRVRGTHIQPPGDIALRQYPPSQVLVPRNTHIQHNKFWYDRTDARRTCVTLGIPLIINFSNNIYNRENC